MAPVLKSSCLDTPLGLMLAISDEESIYLLEFEDSRALKKKVKDLNATLIPGQTRPINLIENELTQYHQGRLREFKTPFRLFGTPFQRRVWEELRKIPYGHTISYSDLAVAIGNPTAYRAVALANGANKLAIMIPCHRVINSNGSLGGYAGGISRKKSLLSFENSPISISN